MSLTQRVIQAFKWSVLAELASRVFGPLIFLVMARLLIPEDFGVAAAASVVISFSQVFSDAGLAKALIQRRDNVGEAATIVFWLNLAIGALVVVLLLLGAPRLADFFHDDRIGPVIRVLSFQILLSAFSSVQTAILQKELEFRPLFWVRLASTTLPGVISIPLAMQGMGYWALAFGSIFGQLSQSFLLWVRSPWRPTSPLNFRVAAELFSFGKWAMLSALLGWFFLWMDAIVVGHYLGAHELGLYRTGSTFVTMIFGLIFSPMLPVVYSTISKIGSNSKDMGELLRFLIKGIAIVSFPVSAALVAFRGPLEQIVFGSQWDGVSTIIAFLAMAHGLAWVVGVNGEFYRGVGKPHIETWANTLSILVYLLGYLVAIRQGLYCFLLMRLLLVFWGLIGHFIVSKIVLDVNFGSLLQSLERPFIISFTTIALLQFVWNTIECRSSFIIFSAAAAITVCGALICFFERDYIKRLRTIINPVT